MLNNEEFWKEQERLSEEALKESTKAFKRALVALIMLKGAHCENVNVRLAIKYPLENEQEKISVINIITKCLGFITGGLDVPINKTI